MENIRLLVFNQTEDELFYLPEKQKLPFQDPKNVPISQKGILKVSESKVNASQGGGKLLIVYEELVKN